LPRQRKPAARYILTLLLERRNFFFPSRSIDLSKEGSIQVSGKDPAKHGPLQKRFKRSVWNAILNAQEKNRSRRKVLTLTDPTIMAQKHPVRQSPSTVMEDFRRIVAERLGKLAAAILDWRMEGRDTKALVNCPELGGPSVWQIKREVQAIKKLAQQFAARLDDPAFSNMVAAAMDREARTVAKRKQAVAARRPRA
jgi:hypothetical protein